MFKQIIVIALASAGIAACGSSSPDADSADVGGRSDASNNGGVNVSNQTAGTNNGVASDACVDIGARFTDAVRAIGRDCSTDADCKLLPRAQACDCDLAVTASDPTGDYDAVRAEADAAQCANPFGCADGECPYRKLSSSGDIYPFCNAEEQCETLQVMSCADYEARAQGGVANPGSCEVDADCAIRNDLNPCDCAESITTNFPFLSVQAIYEMIEVNDSRCSVTCAPCEPAGQPVCATDSEGQKYCSTN